ncbi:MAG: tyrosine-type recombinase/integrase [Clostridia bacterium]|nr:tyrosine-type recombinase/integrase [Clostridia bacterium]
MPISNGIKTAINLYVKNKGGFLLNEYIFKSQKGRNRPLDKSSARKIFNNMAIELNLPYHLSTHFLRKTFAYWFLQAHKNDMSALVTLQEILNHSSEKMTLKYCGIEKERKDAMLKNLAKLW